MQSDSVPPHPHPWGYLTISEDIFIFMTGGGGEATGIQKVEATGLIFLICRPHLGSELTAQMKTVASGRQSSLDSCSDFCMVLDATALKKGQHSSF